MYTERWQRHPLTYVGRGRFWHGPLTMFQMGVKQIWYLVSVTESPEKAKNSCLACVVVTRRDHSGRRDFSI